jgi:hypothetical protein
MQGVIENRHLVRRQLGKTGQAGHAVLIVVGDGDA